jgi:MYXO-CTERM domain-containing protein
MLTTPPHARRWSTAILLCATLLAPATVFAGEVKFGTDPLATDDKGVITSEGRKAATEQIPSAPGEELWPLHLWAKIDKGAPGPLYVEFHGRLPDGKRYLAYRHEHGGYEGEKHVTMELELSGNDGFNKGKTYEVELTQVGPKGPIKLASGKLSLSFTEAPEGAEDDDGDDGDDGLDEQDALDSFAGGEGEGGDGPPAVAPPKKKGCSIDASRHEVPGLLVLLGLAGLIRRRR